MTRLLYALALAAPAAAQWSTAQLSQPRGYLSAATVEGRVLFAGGFDDPADVFQRASDLVDVYDARTGTWSTARLSKGRGYMGATTVGSKAFFAGGVTFQANLRPSNVVDVYDAATDTWSTLKLPAPRRGLSGVSVGAKALFAGGIAGFPGGYQWATDRIDVWDEATGSWSRARLSVARSGMGATSVGDKVLFVGGYFRSQTSGIIQHSDAVDVYDDSTGTWSVASIFPGRRHLGATTVGSRAFFAGGWRETAPTTRVDVYDDATGTWSVTHMSVARGELTASSVAGHAVFAGGRSFAGPSAVADVLEVSTGTWTSALLSVPRFHVESASALGQVLVASGYDYAQYFDHVDVLDLRVGTSACSAAPNSTGAAGLLIAAGSARAAANSFELSVADLPRGRAGYFLASRTPGVIQPPGNAGTLCLAGNVGRFDGTLVTGPVDGLPIDLGAIPVNPPRPVLAGETWLFQCWYRDATPVTSSNFTNAVAVAFQ